MEEANTLKFLHIESGIILIEDTIKKIKKPEDVASLKQLKESLAVLKKKFKMLKKDESLQAQYLDRTCYDVVQGIFQTFHLYVISTDGSSDDKIVPDTLEWLRTHDSAYAISKRLQAAAEKRADFSGAK